MKDKHTPGPWKADPIVCYSVSTGEWIYGDDIVARQSDASLISAAPELLEALEEVTRQYENVRAAEGYPTTDSESIRKARASISKAKGEKI